MAAPAGPGILDTEEAAFRARTLDRVVWTTLGVTTFFLALLVVEQPATLPVRAESIAWIAGLSCIPLVLNRFGLTRLAGWLFVASLVYMLSSGAWWTGGISSPQINSFVLFVLMAGVLLGTVGGLVVGAVCIAIGFGLVWADYQGLLPPAVVEFTPLSNWLYGGIWVTLAALLQHQVASTLRGALRRAEVELAERRRSQHALEEARERLHELAASLQIAREEERRALAMDIHDEIGGGLAGVSLGLRRVRRDLVEGPGVDRERLERLCGDVDRVGETVRRLAREIRPAVLDELGVVAAIRSLVDDTNDRGAAEVVLRVSGEAADLSPADGIQVYRIVQEAVTNAVKHSSPRVITVTVTGGADAIEIAVEDDGSGLPDDAERSRTLGMANMHHRAQLVGGTLELRGSAGRGTRLLLSIPRPAASAAPR